MIVVDDYAKALFELTEEEGNTESVLQSLEIISSLLKENPDYTKLLDSPIVKPDERLALIDRAFGAVEQTLLHFMKILCEKREIHAFTKCAESYKKLYREARNIEVATVLTTTPLTENQINLLKSKLEKMTGKTIELTNTIDASLIGGITLQIAGKQYDDSVKSRLESFKAGLNQMTV